MTAQRAAVQRILDNPRMEAQRARLDQMAPAAPAQPATDLRTVAAPTPVVQRHVYLGEATRPAGRMWGRQQEDTVRRLAAGIAPGHEDRIIRTFHAWIADTNSTGRRFADLEGTVLAIWARIGPSAPELEPSSARIEAPLHAEGATPPETAHADEHSETGAPRLRSEPIGVETVAEPRPAEARRRSVSLRAENATHVGFEIELAAAYAFPRTSSSSSSSLKRLLDQSVNQTLAECVTQTGVLLEMLLDDIKTPRGGGLRAQVEFRTPPLGFDAVTPELGARIRTAINRFPTSIITQPAETQFRLARGEAPAQWRPTQLLREIALQLLRARAEPAPYSLSTVGIGTLAQHATTSIELAAFSTLSEAQQRLLFPQGSGARNKQQLVDALSRQTPEGRTNASTGGRNSAVTTVKTPIESVLAADPELNIPATATRPGSITVDEQTYLPFESIAESVERIRRVGFPSIQGEEGWGYRAVAEKLQPPLRDAVSQELRVLVEHRSGGLVAAVNQALAGNLDRLSAIALAARAMDDAREHRRREAPQYAPGEDPDTVDTSRPGPHAQAHPVASTTAPSQPLDLAGLADHYLAALSNDRSDVTFSEEFLFFRDALDDALAILRENGLSQEASDEIRGSLRRAIDQEGRAAQGGHPDAAVQERIFDAVDMHHGRTLWALLRLFRGASRTRSAPASRAVQGDQPLPEHAALAIDAPLEPLGLGDLSSYYTNALRWANAGSTFSEEFLFFRDHLDDALQILRHGGLSQDASNEINATLPALISNQGASAQGEHPDDEVQEQVFDQLGEHGRNLWALLRYLRRA